MTTGMIHQLSFDSIHLPSVQQHHLCMNSVDLPFHYTLSYFNSALSHDNLPNLTMPPPRRPYVPLPNIIFHLPLLKIVREKPAMINLMRDIPRADTRPIAHAQLLLCMCVPFFALDDLKQHGGRKRWTGWKRPTHGIPTLSRPASTKPSLRRIHGRRGARRRLLKRRQRCQRYPIIYLALQYRRLCQRRVEKFPQRWLL